ncbi:major facilitator superfamily domain-containing protein [Xylariaceae sp. AK1471]|nr:major facilitator superfamily domain-containing protein [Xylariaceae sp. AK1471]
MSTIHPTVETAIASIDRTPTAPEDVGLSPAVTAPPHSNPEPKQDSREAITENNEHEPDDFHPGWRLWAIIAGMTVALILTAFENTAVSVALPVIVSDLDLGGSYIWLTNAFFIASAAIQPLVGQLCNIFGRRWIMLANVAIFTLGSGICGGANNAATIIAGRVIQGLGSGGITLLADIIVSDLVPLRLRGNYLAAILSVFGIAVTIGPFLGGSIVATTTWRWIFYLNLPIGGAALILLFIFLQVHYDDDTPLLQKLKRIDLLGNTVLIASVVSLLFAFAYAGSTYSWGSYHTLVPLILGVFGLFVFGYTQTYQVGRFAVTEPVMPPRLFRHRTSIIIAINTFINSGLTFWCLFFLPVFFQAVKLYGPQYSGVALLPATLVAIPGSALAAVAISRWGRYKPVHVTGFVFLVVGLGLLTLENPDTTVAQWASYQSIAAVGSGFLINSQLPAFQSPVEESDQAAASATWGFIRSIGWVWGVAVPATAFNNRVAQLKGHITDPVALQALSSGGAYGSASAAFVHQFPPETQEQLRYVFSQGVKLVFQVAIAFAGLGFILSLFEDEIVLRVKLKTKYGLKHEYNSAGRAETINAEPEKALNREIVEP